MTQWLYYLGDDWKQDIQHKVTKASYKPKVDGRAFKVFNQDAELLVKLTDDNGKALFIDADTYNEEQAEDSAPAPVDIHVEKPKLIKDMSYNELKKLAKERGVSAKGKKAELIKRLKANGKV